MPAKTIREIRPLDGDEKRRALKSVEELDFACEVCRSEDLEVGDALQLGRLWHNEEHGYYLVALTCTKCRTPTGVRLHESRFLFVR